MRTSSLEWTKCLLNKETRWVCCQHTQIISSIDECNAAFHKTSATSPRPQLHKTAQAPQPIKKLNSETYFWDKVCIFPIICVFLRLMLTSTKRNKRQQHCCWVTAHPRVAPVFISRCFTWRAFLTNGGRLLCGSESHHWEIISKEWKNKTRLRRPEQNRPDYYFLKAKCISFLEFLRKQVHGWWKEGVMQCFFNICNRRSCSSCWSVVICQLVMLKNVCKHNYRTLSRSLNQHQTDLATRGKFFVSISPFSVMQKKGLEKVNWIWKSTASFNT